MSSVSFMGGHTLEAWWDVRCFGGWLVIKAGDWGRWTAKGRRPSPRGLRLPRIYWSPNGTPWHHGARNVFRARYVEREECVCGDPGCRS